MLLLHQKPVKGASKQLNQNKTLQTHFFPEVLRRLNNKSQEELAACFVRAVCLFVYKIKKPMTDFQTRLEDHAKDIEQQTNEVRTTSALGTLN